MLTADCTAEENFALECSRLCLPLPAVALLLLDAASTTEVSVLKHSLFILPNCFNYPARARAVTGRQCPHSGEGEDFLTDFFTETAVTSEQKVEKSIPRWEINRHA